MEKYNLFVLLLQHVSKSYSKFSSDMISKAMYGINIKSDEVSAMGIV